MTRFPEYYLSGIVCILSHLIIIITIGIPILQMRKWRNRRTELPQVTQSKCESQDSTRRHLGVNAWIPATVLIAQWKPKHTWPTLLLLTHNSQMHWPGATTAGAGSFLWNHQSKLYKLFTTLTSQCLVRLEVRIIYLEVATMFNWPKTICMIQLCPPKESEWGN